MSVTNINEISDGGDDTSQNFYWKDFLSRLADVLMRREYACALAMAEFALARKSSPEGRGLILCAKGTALGGMNKFSEAIPVMREALATDRDNPEIISKLSQLLALDVLGTGPVLNRPLAPAEKKKLNEALSHSLQALKAFPLSSPIYSNIGLIHTALGQYSEALPFLKKNCELMARHIENPSLYYNAVCSYVATLSYEARDEHLKEADRLLERSCIEAQADGLNDAANMMRQWRSELRKIPRFPSRYGEKPFELLMN